MAGGSAGDGGEAAKGLLEGVGLHLVVEMARMHLGIDLSANGADPAGVGIDDAAANGDALGQAELVGGLGTEVSDEFAGAEIVSVLLEGKD